MNYCGIDYKEIGDEILADYEKITHMLSSAYILMKDLEIAFKFLILHKIL